MALVIAAACALPLAACTEKPQTAGGHKPDAEPWQGAQAAYMVPGWKRGDPASWEQQIRKRNQGQNEYSRLPSGQ
jgi:hypothetical protein